MAKEMRVAVIAGPRQVRVESLPLPDPAVGQVRIRVQGCGVCHSNLPVWEGREWFRYPLPPGNPGHEGWGTIDAVGPDVREIEAGRRVAFLSSSAYADYDLVAQEALVPLPAAFDAQPFPGEPLGCAMNIFGRSDIRGGQIVAVVGVGFLGALLCRLASQAGASVIALARRPFAQRVARDFGARAVLPMDDHRRIVEEVRDLTAGRFCDRVIECAGAQSTLDLAGELTAERGRLVIAGFHQDGPRQVNLFLWNWRGLDVINAHERDPRVYLEGIRLAVDAVASGKLDPRPLYTHEFPLTALGEAFEAVRTRPDGFLKALVRT
ncbi:MAG TPA: zinc-binding dehydrogenase [Myxococcales bacterium]|jgi:threonine dehydrogenase-like Zn-dependent dehydrogenase|nr:zinc-binding dehydrogenase [Myxococcales bacterium]